MKFDTRALMKIGYGRFDFFEKKSVTDSYENQIYHQLFQLIFYLQEKLETQNLKLLKYFERSKKSFNAQNGQKFGK